MALHPAPSPGTGIPGSSVEVVQTAVRQTVLYADLFDYPLTAPEIHRFLIGVPAHISTVAAALEAEDVAGCVERCGPWFFWRGRRALVEVRERRARVAEWKWRQARRFGALMAALPFVRFVGVTGSLAMDNAEAHEDIDYFIVTASDRLWLARGLVVALARLAEAGGVVLCPNYLVTEANLEVAQQNPFSAHELAQMVPLAGVATYRKLLWRNILWAARYVPNAFPHPAASAVAALPSPLRWAELPLAGALGERIEDWERERKVRKLLQRAKREGGSVAFTRYECRGHFSDRSRQVLAAYQERLDGCGVPLPAGLLTPGTEGVRGVTLAKREPYLRPGRAAPGVG